MGYAGGRGRRHRGQRGMGLTVDHWLRLVALIALAPHAGAGAEETEACGRIGWNAVAVLLTAPCNAAAGALAARAGRRVTGRMGKE